MAPVLNGAPLEGWACGVIDSDHEQLELHYPSPSLGDGVFGLKATPPDAQGQIWMQYWVTGLPNDLVLDSFGLRQDGVPGTTSMQTLIPEWGCEYFKTDFMHFGSEYGPDRAVWHRSTNFGERSAACLGSRLCRQPLINPGLCA